MSEVKVRPQAVFVGEVEWSMAEIKELKDLYAGRPFMEFEKTTIWRSPLIQKAIKSEVIMATSLQKGPKAILHIAKAGLDLIGMAP